MTKVRRGPRPIGVLVLGLLGSVLFAQTPVPAPGGCPPTAAALYSRLSSVTLDEHRIYHVRGATIDRADMHLDLDDGTLVFTEEVCGRITGAFFDGEGEVLLRPPSRVERESLALFTGMAIFEEQFTAGYFRFNDDTAATLQPYLRPADAGDFIQQWGELSTSLAEPDAFRLLVDFSHLLPTNAGFERPSAFPAMLHAHLVGKKVGDLELYWDAMLSEPLWAGQLRTVDGASFFDVWTSCAPGTAGPNKKARSPVVAAVTVQKFRIRAAIDPPTRLQAVTTADLRVRTGGQRLVFFELSRHLKLVRVERAGQPLEFLQNPAIAGTELERKGNDLVAVIFPAPLRAGQEFEIQFEYAGDVISEAGKGLLYVGDRGVWYPNLGLSPADFDLEFHYPADWTLVATGNQVPLSATVGAGASVGGQQVSHWVSDHPIVVAGFNLGKYARAEARSGNIVVTAYGTAGVEKSFPKPPPELVIPPPTLPRHRSEPAMVIATPVPVPSPAHNLQSVADKAARAIDDFSRWFGPYPYHSLELTQMPGEMSQGWPGLIFLSSFAFLNPKEQEDLNLDPLSALLSGQILAHETAHQWWGDLVYWSNYRDQWLVEALANYSALMLLEQRSPVEFRRILDKYRADLLRKNKDGEETRQAGPVTLGYRLISSHFPDGYEAISYERGTWLFHMLRCMLRDAELARSRNGRTNPEEPFLRALRRLRERYAGKSITTQELIQGFEEELPRPLWFENRRSLDWFVDSWIDGTAIPRLEVHGVHVATKATETTVTGTIEQRNAPELLITAIPVYAVIPGRSPVFLGQVLADGRETPFRFNAPAGTRSVALDPQGTLLTAQK